MAIFMAFLMVLQSDKTDDKEPATSGKYQPRAEFRLPLALDGDVPVDHDVVTGWTTSIEQLALYGADQLILGRFPEKQSAFERTFRLLGAHMALVAWDVPIEATAINYGYRQVYSGVGLGNFRLYNHNDITEDHPQSLGQTWTRMWSASVGGDRWDMSPSRDEWITKFWTDPDLVAHQNEVFAQAEAAGVNQIVQNMSFIDHKVMMGHGHPLDLAQYIAGWIAMNWSAYQMNEDIDDYVRDIGFLGVKTTSSRVRLALNLPRVFSATTASLVVSNFFYASTGVKLVERPLEVAITDDLSWYPWPILDGRLSIEGGPTFRLQELVTLGNHAFTFSLENGLAESSVEVGFGWQGQIFKDLLYGEARWLHNFSSGGNWLEFGPMFSFKRLGMPGLSIGILGYVGTDYTIERDCRGHEPSYLSGNETEGGAKLIFQYSVSF